MSLALIQATQASFTMMLRFDQARLPPECDGLRSCCGQNAGEEDEWRLVGQRHEGVDQQCACRALHAGAVSHLAGKQGESPSRADPVSRRHVEPWHTGQSHLSDHRRARLQRGRVRGCIRSGQSPLGEIDGAWKQATIELAYERSGPERFLETFYVLDESIDPN